jgi:hypothetical protein
MHQSNDQERRIYESRLGEHLLRAGKLSLGFVLVLLCFFFPAADLLASKDVDICGLARLHELRARRCAHPFSACQLLFHFYFFPLLLFCYSCNFFQTLSPLLLDVELELRLSSMQYTNLAIVVLLLFLRSLFFLHLLPERSRWVFVFGLRLWVCQPQLVLYPVRFLVCPFLCRSCFVYWVLFAQPF